MADTRAPLGELEEKLLLALVGAGGESHMADIYERLEKAGRTSPMGSIFITLERLGEKGFLESRIEGPRVERGGRSRKLYRVNAEGQMALKESERTRRMLFPNMVWGLTS